MKCLIIGDGWVANNRHKPALKRIGIFFDVIDIKNKDSKPQGGYDFALLCVPPQDRLAATRQCLELGINKFYLEKPISTTTEDAEAILRLINSASGSARHCHNFVFSNVGRHVLASAASAQNVIFTQLNRADRVLPKWVSDLPLGIGQDEFPHIGYLARAFSPELGICDNDIVYIENDNSHVNRWQIEWVDENGYYTADLWRDSVYLSKSQAQHPYWQYKEELHEGVQRIISFAKRACQRVIFKRSNDFGTTDMWRAFIEENLTPQQDRLTSAPFGQTILQDYIAHRSVPR